jgi:hypothetical protein
MKKILLLSILGILAVSFAGCGNKEKETETKVTSSETKETSIETKETEKEAKTEKETQEETQIAEEVEETASEGEIVDNTYTNAAYGFSISFPEDWSVQSTVGLVGGEANVTGLVAAAAPTSGEAGSANVNIVIEKLGIVNQMTVKDEDGYFEAVRKSMAEPMESDGMALSFEVGETEKVEINGVEWATAANTTTINEGELTVHQRMYVKKIDDEVMVITITGMTDDVVTELADVINTITYEK